LNKTSAGEFKNLPEMFNVKELPVLRLIKELVRDPERKSLVRMALEIAYLSARQRGFSRYYFSRYLFKKERTNILDYYPDRFFESIKPKFNDKEAREVLENKLYFDFYYRQFNLNLPVILMYNHRRVFIKYNEKIEVNDLKTFRELLNTIMKNKSGNGSLFVKKTFWSYGGDNIFKIDADQIDADSTFISELYNKVVTSGFLYQETIKQHPDLDRLNPSCLNTIRLDTFMDIEGNVEIMSGYMRLSTTSYHVDNMSSGGAGISVDTKTGRLRGRAILILKVGGPGFLKEHPVTGVTFENFEIPHFQQAKELVIKAATLMPCLRLVGWDVAISESGPVLIEGNSDYDMKGNDLYDLGYRSNPVFRKALKELKYL
jgi:hypothetical protein